MEQVPRLDRYWHYIRPHTVIVCGRVLMPVAMTNGDCPQLLDHEPKAAEQVPLLMKMKRDELALSKAIESGDTDLGG